GTRALNMSRDTRFGDAGLDTITIGAVDLDLTGALLRASGAVQLRAFDLLDGSFAFSFEQKTVDLDVAPDGKFVPRLTNAGTQIRGPPAVNDAKLTTFGLRITSPLFIGAGGVGFTVASGTLALAIVKPTTAGDTRSWLALSASIDGGSFSGIEGLTMTVNHLGVELNRATGAQ